MTRFANPWMLGLLVLVPLAIWAMSRRRATPAVKFSSLGLVRPLRPTLRQRLRFLPLVLRAAAMIGIIVALARPQTGLGEVRTTAKGLAVMMVVDRSYSMIEAMPFQGEMASRIKVVKKVFKDFVEGDGQALPGRPEDMIGLVTFAKYADTIAPLSRVHDTLVKLVDGIQLATDRDYEAGTAIGEGLALGAARLKQAEEDLKRLAKSEATVAPPPVSAGAGSGEGSTPAEGIATTEVAQDADFTIKSKVIILLTDGDENSGDIKGIPAADLCREWGIKVYAIGIGGNEGAGGVVMQTPFGAQRVMMPGGGGFNDDALREIAKITGGKYFPATDGESLRNVYAEIDRLEKTEIKSVEYTSYNERFWPWALGGVAALAMEMLVSSTLLRRSP